MHFSEGFLHGCSDQWDRAFGVDILTAMVLFWFLHLFGWLANDSARVLIVSCNLGDIQELIMHRLHCCSIAIGVRVLAVEASPVVEASPE